jgi:O-methyltransferase
VDYSFFNKPSAKQKILLKLLSPVNKLFTKLGWHIEIMRVTPDREMITVEQRINLFHLVNEMLIHNIEGDFIELGCYIGNSAMQIQAMLSDFKSDKQFHVYDKFNLTSDPANNFKGIFIKNFKKSNIKLPQIHEGFFSETIPDLLPDRISFAHIDCSIGQDQIKLMDSIIFLLEHIYPRMSPNAVCLLMDYHDMYKTPGGKNSHPAIKAACDLFFQDYPEKVNVLYGNYFSHGYFRKDSVPVTPKSIPSLLKSSVTSNSSTSLGIPEKIENQRLIELAKLKPLKNY